MPFNCKPNTQGADADVRPKWIATFFFMTRDYVFPVPGQELGYDVVDDYNGEKQVHTSVEWWCCLRWLP